MTPNRKHLKQKATILTIVILIPGLTYLYFQNAIVSSRYSEYQFVVYALSRLICIAISLYAIDYFNFFKKNFYLKHRFLYAFISILLIYSSINYSNDVATTLFQDQKNFQHSFFLLSNLSIGFFEELFCRVLLFGIFYYLFPKKNTFRVVLISSAFFAALHVTNLFNSEVVKIVVINQILYAFGMGLLFQGILLRLNNVIIVAVIHGLLDYRVSLFSEFIEKKQSLEPGVYSNEDFFHTLLFFSVAILVFALPVSYFLTKNSKVVDTFLIDKNAKING